MYLKRLRDLREDNDLTQDTIAKMLNVSQRAYSRYEHDDRAIQLELLIKLADFYDVSLDYLCERVDRKTSFEKEIKEYLRLLKD